MSTVAAAPWPGTVAPFRVVCCTTAPWLRRRRRLVLHEAHAVPGADFAGELAGCAGVLLHFQPFRAGGGADVVDDARGRHAHDGLDVAVVRRLATPGTSASSRWVRASSARSGSNRSVARIAPRLARSPPPKILLGWRQEGVARQDVQRVDLVRADLVPAPARAGRRCSGSSRPRCSPSTSGCRRGFPGRW